MTSSIRWQYFWALGCLTAALSAQTPPAAPATTPAPEATAPTPNPAPARRSQSREVSAALAGIKFEAPEAKKAEETPPDDVDLRDIDKPRNTIIRLPKYIVEGERPPVFTEQEINTRKGMADLAIKRYLSTVQRGLNQYHLPAILGGISNEDLAMQMYRDNERLKNQKEIGEKLSLFREAGAKETDLMQKDADSTYKQTGSFNDPATSRGPGQSTTPRILHPGDW